MAIRASAASSQASAIARANQVRWVSPTRSTSGAVKDHADQIQSKRASTRSTAQRTRSPTTSAEACAPTATRAQSPSGRKIQRTRPTRSATFQCTPRSYGLKSAFLHLFAAGGAVVERGHQRNSSEDVPQQRRSEKAAEKAADGKLTGDDEQQLVD